MLTVHDMRRALAPLVLKYEIARVDLFGSYANGTATETSDADFLVEFCAEVPSIFKVMGFKEELENELRYPVDVVTRPVAGAGAFKIGEVVNLYERTR